MVGLSLPLNTRISRMSRMVPGVVDALDKAVAPHTRLLYA
jgi:hypothetical protein